MRIRCLIVPFVLAVIASPAHADIELEAAFPNLSFQTAVDIQVPQNSAANNNRIFVVEKRGVISVFPEASSSLPADRTVFLDITAKVQNSGEAGLVGLAFHPNYETNGYFFVYYVSKFPYRNILARYHVSANPNVADAASELILLDIPKNNLFHNGGQIAFAGGLLYVAIGDDQSAANGQDLDDLLGAVLRIAPNVAGSVPAYTIPNGNPFKGNQSGYREEIYAYGFRNPWRFSIDLAGTIWLADVGENDYEEVDWIELGGNYGWPLMEGPECFQPSSCDTAGKDLKLPRDYYSHSVGSAVIGGHVYLGSSVPQLQGLYIFADLNGIIWSLEDNGVDPAVRTPLISNTPGIMAFGVGNAPNRELYVSCTDGSIYRLRSTVTGTDTPRAGGTRLLGNFPNPFNPVTAIRYELAQSARVSVEIMTVAGARVRILEHGSRGAGTQSIEWRGETDAGGRAASGVYFYRLLVDGVARDSARMVLIQ